MDIEKFLESFLQFEHENNMFERKVSGVKIWILIRFKIFYDLVRMFEINTFFETGNTKSNIVIEKNEIKRTWKDLFREKVICNQFLAQKRDIVIVPGERKYKDSDGYYKCIYTDLIDKAMTEPHYLLDKKSVDGIYAKQRSKNVLYADHNVFARRKKKKYVRKYLKKSEMEQIIIPIEKYFNIKIDAKYKKKWFDLVCEAVGSRKLFFDYYNYMLDRIKPKVIILVCYYSVPNIFLCEVAKKRGIPVIELQHGAMGRLHIAYNFFEKVKLTAFPDYIFTFGQFDKTETRFPIEDRKIIPTGYPELENNYDRYCKERSVNKERKVILFISQGISEIAEYARQLANILDAKSYKIVFKLHPKEYSNWKKLYGNFLNHFNIEVNGDYNRTIYSFLAEADWVVGSYSTVLYEATMFDAKIAVLKVSRYKSMKIIYENGRAVLVDSPQSLAQEIMEDTFIVNSNVALFEKNSIKNILDGIDKVKKENGKTKV